jgi:DNA-binding response OmpR family regulator
LNKILIVGEQPLICNLLSRELTQEDYQVIALTDTTLLWKQIISFQPELVLLDLDLHTCDCWQLLCEIKDKKPKLAVLVYAHTGLASIIKLKQAIEVATPTRLQPAASNSNFLPIVK